MRVELEESGGDIKQTWGSVGIGHLEQRPLCGGKTNLPPYPHVCSQRICIRTSNSDNLIGITSFPTLSMKISLCNELFVSMH